MGTPFSVTDGATITLRTYTYAAQPTDRPTEVPLWEQRQDDFACRWNHIAEKVLSPPPPSQTTEP